jgi:GMP synthase-like glutamine amidotransferase
MSISLLSFLENIDAYEESKYPFLINEFKIMEQALKKDVSLLEICLGCQVLAKVLGSKV